MVHEKYHIIIEGTIRKEYDIKMPLPDGWRGENRNDARKEAMKILLNEYPEAINLEIIECVDEEGY
jgi:hypothetical protein